MPALAQPPAGRLLTATPRAQIERIPDSRAANARAAEFGKLLRVADSKEMEDVYTDLLRGGASSPAKRRQAVYGKLGAAERSQRDAKLAAQYGLAAPEAGAGADAPNAATSSIPTV